MSKQLSLSERIIIERMLAQNYTFASIFSTSVIMSG